MSALLPQCIACTRRVTRLGLHVWRLQQQQQVRGKSKAAREAERNIIVKLLQDVPRFGRAGMCQWKSLLQDSNLVQAPISPSTLRR